MSTTQLPAIHTASVEVTAADIGADPAGNDMNSLIACPAPAPAVATMPPAMPPPTTLGQVLGKNQPVAGSGSANVSSASPASSIPQDGGGRSSKSEPSGETGRRSGSKRRRVEDPSVIDMARKLLDARSNEQAAMLSSETTTLTADNHRLIIYLKQLGEKLEKARIENSFLKKLVLDTGGQARLYIVCTGL